eukprot:scpid54128/ scgid8039/ 
MFSSAGSNSAADWSPMVWHLSVRLVIIGMGPSVSTGKDYSWWCTNTGGEKPSLECCNTSSSHLANTSFVRRDLDLGRGEIVFKMQQNCSNSLPKDRYSSCSNHNFKNAAS